MQCMPQSLRCCLEERFITGLAVHPSTLHKVADCSWSRQEKYLLSEQTVLVDEETEEVSELLLVMQSGLMMLNQSGDDVQ